MNLDELTRNERLLYAATERLEAAADTFDSSASLLTEKDMENDALVRDVVKQINQVSKGLESLGAFIRGYAKHRMS